MKTTAALLLALLLVACGGGPIGDPLPADIPPPTHPCHDRPELCK